LILLIACVNFINLSTAQSASRAKEIGIRKVSGAYKTQIVKQFLVETFLVCVVSAVAAIFLVISFLPKFNDAIHQELSIADLNLPLSLLFLSILILLISLIAGSYPAFYLARFNPVYVLKGKLSSGSRNTILRKALVTFQFTITIFLLVSTVVVYRQMDYLKHKKLGYNKDQILCLDNDTSPGFESFKNELKRNAYVQQLGASDQVPSNELTNSAGGIYANIGDRQVETKSVNNVKIDYDFLPVYEFKLVAGRNFNPSFPTDSNAFIINESFSSFPGNIYFLFFWLTYLPGH
jgi:putative ABC transport system permease protein